MSISDSDAIRAIEHRSGEKLARDFIKKQKTKMMLNNNMSGWTDFIVPGDGKVIIYTYISIPGAVVKINIFNDVK